ncbi:MAG: Thiol-disulfide oxidoreductase ResA [Syntrophaceae bacterium PtaU1.Bin231]|nr:MAG: Thiol-disulfide oxidoreductase ResA [Syntrophaceae bacterium PtaU1.Bin231]
MRRNPAGEEDRGGRKRTPSPPLLLVSLALLFGLLFPAVARPSEAVPRIGRTLPATVIPGLEGSPVRIPDAFRGKVAVLHFWRIGCSSCKLEMPAMDRLYRNYRDRGLAVVAVNVGQKKEAVKGFAAELGVSYLVLADAEGKSAAAYGVTDVPRTYIIDRGGIVRFRILGGATPETLKRLVLSLL